MDKSRDDKPVVVITTINPPTATIRRFCDHLAAELVVIGDLKTPDDWQYSGADYYSTARQKSRFPDVAERLPLNHYSRKNIGYLIASAEGASCVVDTDDDNVPLPSWHVPPGEGRFQMTQKGMGFVNVYSAFTSQHIWPRGLPLQDILRDGANLGGKRFESENCRIGVWQGLANGDPDVDAIYRLTINNPCTFDEREPIVLNHGTACPYNSQNTITYRDYFPLLYLPCSVTFRFTDILRGLIGQVLLWENNSHLGFFGATVFQDRNEHDFFKDFLDEDPCYKQVQEVVEIVGAAVTMNSSLSDQLRAAYVALDQSNIVDGHHELPALDAWLNALAMTN